MKILLLFTFMMCGSCGSMVKPTKRSKRIKLIRKKPPKYCRRLKTVKGHGIYQSTDKKKAEKEAYKLAIWDLKNQAATQKTTHLHLLTKKMEIDYYGGTNWILTGAPFNCDRD